MGHCSTGENTYGLITGPAHAIYFATYETVKEALGGNDKVKHHPFAAGKKYAYSYRHITNTDRFVAISGACATTASDAFMNPFDGWNPSSYLLDIA